MVSGARRAASRVGYAFRRRRQPHVSFAMDFVQQDISCR